MAVELALVLEVAGAVGQRGIGAVLVEQGDDEGAPVVDQRLQGLGRGGGPGPGVAAEAWIHLRATRPGIGP